MAFAGSRPPQLEREFLPVRAKILEIAAALDRIQRAGEADTDAPQWQQLRAGIQLLESAEPQRAEEVQLLFSRPYQEQWRESFGLPSD